VLRDVRRVLKIAAKGAGNTRGLFDREAFDRDSGEHATIDGSPVV